MFADGATLSIGVVHTIYSRTVSCFSSLPNQFMGCFGQKGTVAKVLLSNLSTVVSRGFVMQLPIEALSLKVESRL